jgi:hypothetical protein
MKLGLTQLLVSPLSKNASQPWRFVTLEAWVISHKKEPLQPLSVPKNVVWNSLTFGEKVIDESVDRGGDALVNQSIRLR